MICSACQQTKTWKNGLRWANTNGRNEYITSKEESKLGIQVQNILEEQKVQGQKRKQMQYRESGKYQYNIYTGCFVVNCTLGGKMYLYDLVDIKKEASNPLKTTK